MRMTKLRMTKATKMTIKITTETKTTMKTITMMKKSNTRIINLQPKIRSIRPFLREKQKKLSKVSLKIK